MVVLLNTHRIKQILKKLPHLAQHLFLKGFRFILLFPFQLQGVPSKEPPLHFFQTGQHVLITFNISSPLEPVLARHAATTLVSVADFLLMGLGAMGVLSVVGFLTQYDWLAFHTGFLPQSQVTHLFAVGSWLFHDHHCSSQKVTDSQ